MPHHVTQRGNRRQQTFFGEEDYQHYLELMARFCRAEQVATWAYCLMPNHVHLIVVPRSDESLRRAIGEARSLDGARGVAMRGDGSSVRSVQPLFPAAASFSTRQTKTLASWMVTLGSPTRAERSLTTSPLLIPLYPQCQGMPT